MGTLGTSTDRNIGARPDRRAGGRRVAMAAALALLLAGACSSAGGDDDSAAGSPGTPAEATSATAAGEAPCSTARHLVVFDFLGTVTEPMDAAAWLADPNNAPGIRAGALALVGAYRERGYEVLYVATVPADITVGGMPVAEAITTWLAQNGFPTGHGAEVWVWDGAGDVPSVALIDELLARAGDGVSVDHGYTESPDKVHAMAGGGVDPPQLHTMGEAATVAGSTPIPNDDLVAHLAEVERMPAVCRPV